jgi:hypothetical protein
MKDYTLDSVGTSTEKYTGYQHTQYEFNKKTSIQTQCKQLLVFVLAQQENKGNNQQQ